MYQEEEDDSKLQENLLSEGGKPLNLHHNLVFVYPVLLGDNPPHPLLPATSHHHQWLPFPNTFLLSLAEDGI